LGVRVEALRKHVGVVPILVIVPDARSYAAAIASWSMEPRPGDKSTLGARFPVLIDDGSWHAREDIARFGRDFKPKSVVRWKAPDSFAWPEKGAELEGAIERCAYKSWGGGSLAEVKARWAAGRFEPPGVVAASTGDPAWTAALALAAGHGQIFAWVESARDLSGSMNTNDAAKLNRALQKACDAAGFQWSGIGTHIDAVTLCMSTPASVRASAGDSRSVFATTDVIGRDDGDEQRRWAWAGQIPGNESAAAYAAMCALFIEPSRAWLFDGYPNEGEKAKWDASAAAEILEKGEIGTLVNDNGNQGMAAWRNRAAGMGLATNSDAKREPGAGVDAGFITVNTSGFPEIFDLQPGRCGAVDAPFLNVPAAVHFVHSYSAARPGDRNTIAGRFLERGAFAYVGSVHEPFLQAFVTTPAMCGRMLALGPWGASVRLDDAPKWRIAVFGDPLWTLGPRAPRIDAPLPLEGAQDIQDLLAPAVKEKRFADAVWILALQGRDDEAARLVRVIVKDAPASLTPEVALAGIMPTFRAQGREEAAGSGERLSMIARLSNLLEPQFGKEPELRDIVWQAAYPSFGTLREPEILALATAMRPEVMGRDAAELVGAATASLGRDRALSAIRKMLPQLKTPAARGALEKAMH
jgi:hypothetical protein